MKHNNKEYKVLKLNTINSIPANLEKSTDNLVIEYVNTHNIITGIENTENYLLVDSSGVEHEGAFDTALAYNDYGINKQLHNSNGYDTDEDLILEESYMEEVYTKSVTYTLDDIFNQEKELFQSFSQNKIAMLANLIEASIISNPENDQDPALTELINQTESLTSIDLSDDIAINNHLQKIANERNDTPSDI